MDETMLLYFDDEHDAALRLADAAGCAATRVHRHRFPDGEFKVRVPTDLPPHVVVYRSMTDPNDKLIELLLTAQTARAQGAHRLTLVAPYLAYMRQDIEFLPGESISQRIVGRFLAGLFDALITVDPHLHRVDVLGDAVPVVQPVCLSAAPLLAEWVARERDRPLLIGPDAESVQWVASAAEAGGLEHAVCTKVRHGDREVEVVLPPLPAAALEGRAVVILDDVVSTGQTVVEAARVLRAAGVASVDLAITHALFEAGAYERVRAAGVGAVWSADGVAHVTNAVALAPLLAAALSQLDERAPLLP